jgi:hypothetical protein
MIEDLETVLVRPVDAAAESVEGEAERLEHSESLRPAFGGDTHDELTAILGDVSNGIAESRSQLRFDVRQ